MWSSVNLCDLIDKLEPVFSLFRRGNERVMGPSELRSKHKHLNSQKGIARTTHVQHDKSCQISQIICIGNSRFKESHFKNNGQADKRAFLTPLKLSWFIEIEKNHKG